jgi:serine/threonine protein kinase
MRDAETQRLTVTPGTPSRRTPTDPQDEASTTVLAGRRAVPAQTVRSLAAHYVVLERIAEGGMGVLYLGKDRRLSRYVAVKRLTRAALVRPELRERFLREARAIAALQHIHIVHIYELGEDRDGPYIVMEYVAGPQEASPSKVPPAPFSLADRIHRNGPLSVEDALDMIGKVGRAMEYAHGCGVIHRDLKPSNVLLDETGEPKVVDFGLARMTGGNQDAITAPGDRILTLGYGAPEQEKDASLSDHRVDVYGLGALLYFCITGQNPRYFRENDVPEILRMLIVKALETDREKRWSTVREFLQALAQVKAPTTFELATSKRTWRCKWCDTINPTSVQFCGKCGWDGGVICPECGQPARFGIQFCGNCGADGREYEAAQQLLDRLETCRESKAYEMVPRHAERISGFHPSGPNGRRIVEKVERLRKQAERAVARRRQLLQILPQEIGAGNLERAGELIREYDDLASDGAFAGERERLPALLLARDLDRARRAIKEREWDYARRTCLRVLEKIAPRNEDALRLLRRIRVHRTWVASVWTAAAITAAFLVYVFSAAPAYAFVDGRPGKRFTTFYGLAVFVQESTFLRKPLEKYAAALGASDLYRPPPVRQPPLASGPRIPATSPETWEKLSQLRTRYDEALARVEAECAKRLESWPREYTAALKELLLVKQRAGDFEAWTAVNDEIARFGANPVIPESVPLTSPRELTSLQAKYQKIVSGSQLEKSGKIVALANDYVRNLNAIQKDLTVKNRMDEAARVNVEIKRVQSSPEVTAARYDVEQSRAGPGEKPKG